MQTVLHLDLISQDPAVRGGRPCIAGTGLRVTDVVMAQLFHRRTPDEIATDYDISLAQVHAALAYYFQNKTELDEDIRRQIVTAQRFKEEQVGVGDSLPPR
ncbi:MAG: DUF433 domain-containing protein [Caldilineaceae bacterium]|nr:DUF433 domain-containing protein [Caldilineaceae bacterium]